MHKLNKKKLQLSAYSYAPLLQWELSFQFFAKAVIHTELGKKKKKKKASFHPFGLEDEQLIPAPNKTIEK